MQLYWGILHCHVRSELCHKTTTLSDEELAELSRQIDALYAFARDDREFDFLAYADHDNMGRMIQRGDVPGSPWRLVKEKARQYARPGSFVPLLGYEYQDGMEYNVYLHGTEQLPLAPRWAELMEQVAPDDPHILLAAHNRPSPTDWNFPIHPNFRLIEIMNDGSVFEGWAGEGLRRGHAAGFIGGSDDHGCRPGRNSCTGVWAPELTADAIWEGLRARRTVAATGIRPELEMTVNGVPMGGVVPQADRFAVVVRHCFELTPAAVMLIADGELLAQHRPDAAGFEMSRTFDGVDLADRRTLYAKVFYPDGNLAFGSPVFLPDAAADRGPACPTSVSAERTELTDSDSNAALPGGAPSRASRKSMSERATRVPIETLRELSCVEEFGARVGWHNWVNAGPLVPDRFRPMQRIRDMVVHTGPDALLVRANGDVVTGTMDGIVAYDGERKARMLHDVADDPCKGRLITSLVELGETVIGAGYLGEEPCSLPLCGDAPKALEMANPIQPYLYGDRFVTPRYLASDGLFLYCLAERECSVMIDTGKLVAYCQTDYPSFPCAVDGVGLDCIVILSCDGDLVCYDAAASQTAVVRWRIRLPEARSGVTIMNDEVWCYNRSFHGCYSCDPIEITVIARADGTVRGRLRPELVNIRGTAIRPLDEKRFVALHNPTLNGAAVFRKELNTEGKVRVYA